MFLFLTATTLILKAVLCVTLAGLTRIKQQGIALLFAWLALQALQISGMVVLSAFGALAPASYWAWLCVQTIVILAVGWRQRWSVGEFIRSAESVVRQLGWGATLLAGVLTGLLAIRAYFFFDTGYDAYSYGLTRIAYFFQNNSVFALGATKIPVYLFAYEWNAELMGFHYLLTTFSDRGLMLAGVETGVVMILAFRTFARALGTSTTHSLWVALLVASTPIAFNLTGVFKGDSIAMVATVAALATLATAVRSPQRSKLLGITCAWMAFAAGCKGTMPPLFAVITAACIYLAWPDRSVWSRSGRAWPVVAGFLIGIFLLRHFANAWVFHNPLEKDELTKLVRFSLPNATVSIGNQFLRFFGLTPNWHLDHSFQPSISASFGYTGWAMLAAFPALIYWLSSRHSRQWRIDLGFALKPIRGTLVTVLVASTGVWIYISGLIPCMPQSHLLAHGWTPDFRESILRYFMPFYVPLALILFGLCARATAPMHRFLCGTFAGLIVIGNLYTAFRPTEIMAVRGLRRLPVLITTHDHFATKLLDEFHPTGYRPDLGDLATFQGQPQEVLVYHDFVPIYPLFGENLEWRVTLTDSPEGLSNSILQLQPEWIALCRRPVQPYSDSGLEASKDVLDRNGYRLNANGRWWKLYRREDLTLSNRNDSRKIPVVRPPS